MAKKKKKGKGKSKKSVRKTIKKTKNRKKKAVEAPAEENGPDGGSLPEMDAGPDVAGEPDLDAARELESGPVAEEPPQTWGGEAPKLPPGRLFTLLSIPEYRRILLALEEKPRSLPALAETLGRSTLLVSMHLETLKKEGLIVESVDDTGKTCRLQGTGVGAVLEAAKPFTRP